MADDLTTLQEPVQQAITPSGFFGNIIEPVFNEDVFNQENLSAEVQRPDLTSPLLLRDQVVTAANDEDLSLLEYDAAAGLAAQTLMSDLTSQDVYTRSKRDLQYNISAEQDIQFQQGRQLLSDMDAFIQSNRATVEQREYEKELERQEKLLEEQKKEELQFMAMQMVIDPDGMSRSDLRSSMAESSASRYADSQRVGGSSGSSRGGSGGWGTSSSGGCAAGMEADPVTGICRFKDVLDATRQYDISTPLSSEWETITNTDGTQTAVRKPIDLDTYLFNQGYSPSQVGLAVDAAAGLYTQPSNKTSDTGDVQFKTE